MKPVFAAALSMVVLAGCLGTASVAQVPGQPTLANPNPNAKPVSPQQAERQAQVKAGRQAVRHDCRSQAQQRALTKQAKKDNVRSCMAGR